MLFVMIQYDIKKYVTITWQFLLCATSVMHLWIIFTAECTVWSALACLVHLEFQLQLWHSMAFSNH